MRKFLTFASTLICATNFVFANEAITSPADMFYVKTGIGYTGNMLKVKGANNSINSNNNNNNNNNGNNNFKLNKFAPIYMLGVGKYITNKLHIDATIDYSKYTKNAVKINMWKFMLDGIYDISQISSNVNLYGLAGVGAGKIIGRGNDGKKVKFKAKLAWSVGSGFNIKINDRMSWDIGYKYSDILNIKQTITNNNSTSDNVTIDPAQHSLMATFRFGL